jgi:hypothetical protein
MLQAPGVPGKWLPVIVPAAQDLLGDSTGNALQRSASVRLCSALFAKPLRFTLAWRFVSPRDGAAAPPIQ